MTVKRGTSNSNQRGSAESRRRRKQWLLDTFGNGTIAFCSYTKCSSVLDFDTITVDRHPTPGIEGGRYVRGNIRPMCGYHNSLDGHRLMRERRT